MVLYNLADLVAGLAPGERLLGLDPGSKRIGVALSDVSLRVASPYGMIPRAKLKQNAVDVLAIAVREGVGGLVIGLPLDELGRSAQAARDWAHAMSATTELPVVLQDESFTTQETHERLIAAGVSRARRDQIIDKMAAAAILQRALDTLG
jgi:putative Holliday junction resolvase